MTRLRILVAADVPPDPNSGAAGTEYQAIRALRRLGHEVDEIWAHDLPHRIRHGNLHHVLELPKGLRDAIRRQWQRRTYDVVHVNQPAAYLAAMDHQRQGRPGVFVNRSHGLELRARQALRPWRRKFGVHEWRFPRAIIGHFLQAVIARNSALAAMQVDGTIVCCTECRDFLMRRHGVPGERVAAIPAAPPDTFQTTPAPAPCAARFRRLLYVGQFTFMKAPIVLARAVSRVMDQDGDCALTWVCQAECHAEARSLLSRSAAGRTTFLDWRDQQSLMRVYDAHGIFLFPSFFEGFGKAFLEAMARGLCVVASNVGGMRDVIGDGHDGYLVPAGDTEALAHKVMVALRSPDRAAAIGEMARRTASAYTWERAAREMEAFYEHLLALKGSRRGACDECPTRAGGPWP